MLRERRKPPLEEDDPAKTGPSTQQLQDLAEPNRKRPNGVNVVAHFGSEVRPPIPLAIRPDGGVSPGRPEMTADKRTVHVRQSFEMNKPSSAVIVVAIRRVEPAQKAFEARDVRIDLSKEIVQLAFDRIFALLVMNFAHDGAYIRSGRSSRPAGDSDAARTEATPRLAYRGS